MRNKIIVNERDKINIFYSFNTEREIKTKSNLTQRFYWIFLQKTVYNYKRRKMSEELRMSNKK